MYKYIKEGRGGEGRELTVAARQRLHVQHHHRRAQLLEAPHNGVADAAGAARHQHDLAAPDVTVRRPVVAHALRQPPAHRPRQRHPEQRAQPPKRRRVQNGQVLAALGEARQQQRRQQQRRVERRVADQPQHHVGAEALARDETLVKRHRWEGERETVGLLQVDLTR